VENNEYRSVLAIFKIAQSELQFSGDGLQPGTYHTQWSGDHMTKTFSILSISFRKKSKCNILTTTLLKG
jgi:hypothetical protein